MNQNLSIISVKISNLDLQIAACIDQRTEQWVVLLHGLQSNQKMYEALREQDFLKPYSVLSLDFLGFGTQLEKTLNLNNNDRKTGELIAHSAEEAANLKTFEKEKTKRLQLIKKIPDYHVGGVSLYYREDSCFDGSMWTIWPGSLKEEFFKSIQNFKLALQHN